MYLVIRTYKGEDLESLGVGQNTVRNYYYTDSQHDVYQELANKNLVYKFDGLSLVTSMTVDYKETLNK